MSFLQKLVAAVVILGAVMFFDPSSRSRVLHLGLCGAHKVNAVAFQMNQINSLESINSLTDTYLTGTERDVKLDILMPRGVNLKVAQTEEGKWIDPCDDSRYGCQQEGRPAVVFLPVDGETIGSLPLIARAANASLLLCESDALKCIEAAYKNSTKIVLVGSGSVLTTHQKIVQQQVKVPSAYWLLSPVLEAVEPKPWYSGDSSDVVLPTLTQKEKDALPVMFVTTSASTTESTEKYLKEISPEVTIDNRSNLPHNFVVFSEWFPDFALTTLEARALFDATL
eukprot:TRINITY_DN18463_c0_g1_i1.p1 TRINITY_DN18463_c0_g1~~TRINITY_DN18463_c0_g1_i1.p1  ORF type:complete len:282 (+),score=44.79 TRINITY_DN18463_c0_g1_i1:59-904(+)